MTLPLWQRAQPRLSRTFVRRHRPPMPQATYAIELRLDIRFQASEAFGLSDVRRTPADGLFSGYPYCPFRAPRFHSGCHFLRCDFETSEFETRRDGLADRGPLAQLCADCHAGSGTIACGRSPALRSGPSLTVLASSMLMREFKFERCAGVTVPDLGRVDPVPMRAIAARAEHRSRSRPRGHSRGACRGTSRGNSRFPDAP